jgi:putative transposase
MQFVAASVGAEPIWKHLNRQVYLGSDAFVQRMQDKAGDADDINVPRAHRRPPPPSLEAIAAAYPDRDAAMLAAHRTGEYS